MESKTFEIIQAFARVGWVLSRIAYIASIVGAALSLVALIALPFGSAPLVIGGVSIYGLIGNAADVSLGSMYAGTALSFTLCLGEVFIAFFAARYFKNELAAGTPFTFEGAKELRKVAICTMAVSLGCAILAHISYNIINMNFANVADMSIDSYIQVGLGFAFLVISLLLKLGTEQIEAAKKATAIAAPVAAQPAAADPQPM